MCSARYVKYAERAVPLTLDESRGSILDFTSCTVLIHFVKEILDCLKICWCHIKDEPVILTVRSQVQLACGANLTKLWRGSGKINFYLGGKINFVSFC